MTPVSLAQFALSHAFWFTCRGLLVGLTLIVAATCGVRPTLAQESTNPAANDPPRKHTNRLAKETSPYLLLHAHNPVEWYPWGPEAFDKAKAEGKVVFLSIGYSSCYWCHVMERESFMDDEIAAYLNRHFVCIKVDREERPDIDEIYMETLQLLNRRGGWPLSMFLTPDAKPIFGGTYFPPRDREVATSDDAEAPPVKQTGFMTLLSLVQDAWTTKHDEIVAASDNIAAAVRQSLARRSLAIASPPAAEFQKQVLEALSEEYDAQYGGFGYSESNDHQPKFPQPPNLLFLLDVAGRDDDARAREMVLHTLSQMAAGGIRDHVGGGFHRYSTDRFWRVPHFEKMLYDNAQLAVAYLLAHVATGREEFRQVVVETLEFMERDLGDPGGGFYAALDAETDAKEGEYYVWRRKDLEAALTADELRLADLVYGTAQPNFEGASVLLLPQPLSKAAAELDVSPDKLPTYLLPIRDKLLSARRQRPAPLTDTKILAAWNGLAIRAFAMAGDQLGEPKYTEQARRAAEFVLANHRTAEGRLLRTWTAGQARLNAYLDDYALVVDGLLALAEATGQSRWLEAAEELTRTQIELFWDDKGGGFYYTSSDHEQLLARSKNPIDSVLPSGNSVSASNLAALAKATGNAEYLDRARRTINAFGGFVAVAPGGLPRLAMAAAAAEERQKRQVNDAE